MNKPVAIIILAVLAGAASYFAYQKFTNSQYEKYPAGLALVDVRFQHPKKWKILQDKGKIDPYAQVVLLGPRNPSDTFTVSFIVRKSLASGNRMTAEDMKRLELNRFFLNKTVVSETAHQFRGVQAQEVTVTYTLPANFHSGMKAIPTEMKTRYLVLKRNEYIYEIMYDADRSEYPLYEKHFERLLKTFRFNA